MIKCDHVTVAFGVRDTDEVVVNNISNHFYSVFINQVCHNDRIQAAIVIIPELSHLFPEGKIPHVTISHIEGAKPVESNTMLLDPSVTTTHKTPIFIEGVLEFKPF
jgi:hypothetical protein